MCFCFFEFICLVMGGCVFDMRCIVERSVDLDLCEFFERLVGEMGGFWLGGD